MLDDNRFAPKGKIWICTACGKLAYDRYAIEGWHSYDFDESCMLNSILIEEDHPDVLSRLPKSMKVKSAPPPPMQEQQASSIFQPRLGSVDGAVTREATPQQQAAKKARAKKEE